MKHSKLLDALDLSPAERKTCILALNIIANKMQPSTDQELTSPNKVREAAGSYFALTHGAMEREVMSVMFLDNQHCLITVEDLFYGTIDEASVYPREVVKSALKCNAAVVVLTHNHPSGVTQPSQADIRITRRINEALELVGMRVLDHIIIGKDSSFSFAENAML